MSSTVLALIAAILGVTGTLLAPVLSQRSQAKALKADFERQQQATQAQWRRDQMRAALDQRRACYVATNAAFRRYRVQLMNYLHHVHRGEVGSAVIQQLEEARQAHHVAFAEAQMIASDPVMEHLDQMVISLGDSYRRTKELEEGNPGPDGSFEEIQEYLRWLWDRWEEMRKAMRADLGANYALGESAETDSR